MLPIGFRISNGFSQTGGTALHAEGTLKTPQLRPWQGSITEWVRA